MADDENPAGRDNVVQLRIVPPADAPEPDGLTLCERLHALADRLDGGELGHIEHIYLIAIDDKGRQGGQYLGPGTTLAELVGILTIQATRLAG